MSIPLGLKFNELHEFMIGRRFGRLIVTKYQGKSHSDRRWECICDCGNVCSRKTTSLREVKDHSCRCWGIEKCSTAGLKHGMHKTSEYQTYFNMRQRCYNPKVAEFEYYGARGIKVCDRWLESFDNFIADMGKKPGKKYSLDRIDVNGNYEPGNCRWADVLTQANNTRRNSVYTVNGITATLAEHCRRTGVNKSTVLYRLKKGIEPEIAFK